MPAGYKPDTRIPWLSQRKFAPSPVSDPTVQRRAAPSDAPDTKGSRYSRSRVAERCTLLYDNFLSSTIAHSILAVVMVWSQTHRIDSAVLTIWSCLVALAIIVRSAIWLAYQRKPTHTDFQFWLNLYLGGAVLGSAVWSVGGVYLAFTGDMLTIGMGVTIIAGIAAGAVALLGSHFVGSAVFILVLTIPFATALVLSGNTDHMIAGFLMYAFVLFSVTASKRHEQTLLMAFQSRYDPLTLLRNRHGFESVLNSRAIRHAKADESHVLAFIDLDRFKIVNDTAGHLAGDDLLHNIAQKLELIIGDEGYVCRIGGDEFAVVFPNCVIDRSRELLTNARNAISAYRHNANGRLFRVTTSIGVTEFCKEDRIDDVLAAADLASYAAKKLGGNRIHVNTEDDQETGNYRVKFDRLSDIESAMDERRLLLVGQLIQPIRVAKSSKPVYSIELLVRIRSKTGNLLPASEFIPIAEDFGLMPIIDRWVIPEAITFMNSNQELLKRLGCCYINISTQSLGDADFANFLEHQLDRLKLPSSKICFEVTEGESIRDMAAAVHFMQRIKRRGCRFALDDFGNGFSSLRYLQTLPVDIVKIDKSYVRSAPDSKSDAVILTAIAKLSRSLNKITIGEGVENKNHHEFLKNIGVDFMQGHALHKPERLDSLVEKLSTMTASKPSTSHTSNDKVNGNHAIN